MRALNYASGEVQPNNAERRQYELEAGSLRAAIRKMSDENKAIVDAWLEHNEPRRFTRGDGGTFFACQRLLEAHNIWLNAHAGSYLVRMGHDAERQRMKWAEVLDLVDTIRAACGLETLRAKHCVRTPRRTSNGC